MKQKIYMAIMVPEELHLKIKIRATAKKISIIKYVEQLLHIEDYLIKNGK